MLTKRSQVARIIIAICFLLLAAPYSAETGDRFLCFSFQEFCLAQQGMTDHDAAAVNTGSVTVRDRKYEPGWAAETFFIRSALFLHSRFYQSAYLL